MSSKGRFDVIVAGVGAMGAAACFHLARRGARVLGLEQLGIPHEIGSSGGHTRLIRREALADLALDSRTDLPIDFMSLKRFL